MEFVVLWSWFVFSVIGLGASWLINALHCGNIFGFDTAPAQFQLLKPPPTNDGASHQIFLKHAIA